MVDGCKEHEGHIVCHEHMTYEAGYFDEETGDDPSADGPICRGFYDRYGKHSLAVRIAIAMDCLQFVTPEGSRSD